MRIVYVQLSPTFGMHQYAADLANRMSELHEVHLLTTKSFPADRYAPAVVVHAPADVMDTGLSRRSLHVDDLGQVVRKLRSLDADVVHLTGPHLWNPILIWSLRRRCPVIHTLHDLVAHPGSGYGRLLGVWNRIVISLADCILVHGRRFRQALAIEGFSSQKLTHLPLLHLCFSHETVVHFLEKNGSDGEQLGESAPILFFGRVEPYKGVEILLDAYARLADRVQTSDLPLPRLVIAGAGKLTSGRATKLPETVTWHNRQIADEEAARLFRACSVVVLPYVEASQSAIIGTAYFFGKPVIVTDTGALPEYVSDGVTGLVVESGNAVKLANALAKLVWSPPVAERMGKAARQWYDRHRASEYEALVALYENLVGSD